MKPYISSMVQLYVTQWITYFSNVHNEKGQNELSSTLNSINPTSESLNEPFTYTEFYETLTNQVSIKSQMKSQKTVLILSYLCYLNI